MMNVWRFLFVFLAIGLLAPVFAVHITIDLCGDVQHRDNNEFLKHFVVLAGTIEKRADDNRDTRHLTVDRVISGDVPYKHGDQCPVTVSAMFDDYLAKPGKYLLLIQRLDNGKLLLSDDCTLLLGPVQNFLELPSFDDPVITDAQLVIDTFSIPSDALRWQQMTALWPHVENRPFVWECFLRAMVSQYRATVRDYNFALEAIFREPEKYHPATVLFADQLRRGANPMHPVPSLRQWTISAEEYDLLEKLGKALPDGDPNRAYLRRQRTEAVPEFRGLLLPGEKERLHEVSAPDIWPIAAVVDFPNVADHATRCTVNVERVISGEQVLAPGKQDILLEYGRGAMQMPPAGKYLCLFTVGVDQGGREMACFDHYYLVLGSVINYCPVTSASDPTVDDLRTLLLYTRNQRVALWQPLWTDTVEMKQHPLLANFNLRQSALRAATMEKTCDEAALEILLHPQNTSPQLILITDRLFTTTTWSTETISDAARKWKTSPERRTLLQDMQKCLTSADDRAPYYSSSYVKAALKEFDGAEKP